MSIKVSHVTKYYGSQKALDDVSFEVKTGEVVGFLGPNGAGKSTMMKIITGFIPSSSGEVKVNDLTITDHNIEIKKQIGYLPENNPLYPDMYIKEYLQFVSSFYHSVGIACTDINDIIELTGLSKERHKKIGSLSKGYKQRVGLAQSLVHNPQVLILDEPTTGLDPNQIVEIRNLIRNAGKEKTVMLSTHIMQEVEAICDRILIIDKGRLVADEKKEDIYSAIGSNERQSVIVEFDKTIDEASLLSIPNVESAEQIKNGTWCLKPTGLEDIRPNIFAYAVENGVTVLSMRREETNLETVFRELTH